MKRGLTFLTGMLMGAALFGGGTAYAAGLMAEPINIPAIKVNPRFMSSPP